MGFFGWFFVIMLGIYFTGRVFGRHILRWALRRVQMRAMKEMEKQAHAYSRNYQGANGKKTERVNPDMTVEYEEKNAASSEPKWNDLAEDVDFEEVK